MCMYNVHVYIAECTACIARVCASSMYINTHSFISIARYLLQALRVTSLSYTQINIPLRELSNVT